MLKYQVCLQLGIRAICTLTQSENSQTESRVQNFSSAVVPVSTAVISTAVISSAVVSSAVAVSSGSGRIGLCKLWLFHFFLHTFVTVHNCLSLFRPVTR